MRKWVEALRSGDFLQGEGNLAYREDDGPLLHCCLGVACELAIADGVVLPRTETATDHGFKVFFNYRNGFMPEQVSQWLGLLHGETDGNVKLIDPSVHVRPDTMILATEANDVYNWDFRTIADAIERTYLGGEDGE